MFRCSRFAEARGALLGAGVVLLAALVPLSGCGLLSSTGSTAAPGPAASAVPRTYTVTSAVTTVIVNGGAGMIAVTGGDRGTVQVTERLYHSNGKKPPTASHAVSGGTLTLSYSCPTQLTCGVGYAVAVPRGVTVRVFDREGAITLADLSGPVTAQTLAGAITATGLASPRASLTTHTGSIRAAFSAPPDSVTATTNVGSVALRLPASATYKVTAQTYVGNSTITVPQSTSSAHVISASSDLGSVTISPS